mmetsp:Transcript_11103/g.19353  ORF Transcript_11103/g.19353 Transcript_11103/m.19353 type:complete len:416 (+) Transcript_11103:279-1526(+)|eukprot:CAMPEP_0119112528 /NCGR_PEP_ID=MMETSP1180-20130426/40629_1 /TAXON_ID=3052 ORGANISM="Chlamydomonas cf sp, Strain CCMP681" /NCGR_SAMPLE_ID=MMETSP1180 /ASSEMBLY_ACC=CAM_ASM_000741 /LENGTH=415 /DNA_ID=CAMNT_0007100069 /DNA_START=218 /DNA_END=1465 /DNA_ORIENTATION=-
MILRLRSRDGLERVELQDGASLAELKQAINAKLGIPHQDLHLSKDPALLTTKTPQEFTDLTMEHAGVRALGCVHGDMLYMLYSGERQVEPVVKKGVLDSRPFGAKTTVSEIAAKQMRVERQDKAVVASISFDRQTANQFQQYVQGAFKFSIKRGGLLYGTVEDNEVKVEFIYEPPQQGEAMNLELQRSGDEESMVDFLAGKLGLKKVGFIFSQSTAERDFIAHTGELLQMAAMQAELGETCTTVVVSWDQTADEPGGHVHFEAFQCSKQCVELAKDGWLLPTPAGQAPCGVTKLVSPKDPGLKYPVMAAGKDVGELDNDYFLVPVKILDHQGPLLTAFPIENRLLPQGKAELAQHLRKFASTPYVERISDLHLLLWLSKQPNLDQSDMSLLVDAVKSQSPVLEGYRLLIDSVAGI